MRSPGSTFIIIFLSITTIILLFNHGTITDTVSKTYQQDLSHDHGSPYSPSPQTSSKSDSGPKINAVAIEAEVALPDSNNSSLATSPFPAQVVTLPHLSALCANTTFQPGLFLHCHSFGGPLLNAIHGGLSNARNRYSSCIRLAIDAGANMVIGSLMQRDNENLRDTDWRQVGPETMIDVEVLQKLLKEACPGMDVRGCPEGSCDEGTDFQTVIRAPDHDHSSGSFTTGKFREILETAIAEDTDGTISRSDISPDKSVKVEFGDSFMGWNYTAVHESYLKAEIFQLLHFAPELLSLGQKVQEAAKKAAKGRDIVGIHFRGEEDWPSSVCDANAQIEMYGKELERWNRFRLWKWKLRDIYLSCGDQERVQMFRDAMKQLGYVVHDKHSLLNNTESWGDEAVLREIERLNFDQKAVVEYVNLRDASRFLGLLPSTLSYIVAYRRTLSLSFSPPLDAGLAASSMRPFGGKGRKWSMPPAGKKKERIGWFEKYILAGSWRGEGLSKHWAEEIQMRGDERTKLLVVDGQSELSDAFP